MEGLLADGDKNDSVRTKAILGGGLDILDDVAGFGKVDETLGKSIVFRSGAAAT